VNPKILRLVLLALGLGTAALVAVGLARLTTNAHTPGATTRALMSGNPPITEHRRPNHLAREKSPYLLQHLYNPVDWYPWGEPAFEKARREGKPIFLSIGYSTCHWCHVMERESFENDAVARLLNDWFVAIKVDREERPDVDRLYMTAAQAMGLGGGWPLNMFLTPGLEPFYGGTYFPPDSAFGRPGLMQVLASVHQAWTTRRAEIEQQGQVVIAALDTLSAPGEGIADRAVLLDRAAEYLARAADHEHGGFGGAPKFPSTVNLAFLLRRWAHDPSDPRGLLELVTRQLDAMRAGGIHDHLGGGFHRYATDANWLVPHFEKMLYDQAQLAWSYLEGYQVTGKPEYAAAAAGIFAYVERDLTVPEGAFDSAEDADSEGREGRFYVWTPREIEAALPQPDAAWFEYRYGVSTGGNFEHGTTILHEAHTIEETARHAGAEPAMVAERLERARAILLDVRSKRVRPHRDDKVLTAWNGLMISALARGARVLGDPDLAVRAERAADFVWSKLHDERTGTLVRRWRDGEAAGAGQLDDYAYYALGLIDLYGATHDPRWLERAVLVTEAQIARFYDAKDGGFWESPAGDPALRLRMKDGFDGAEMAGNSIAAQNLIVLGRLLDRHDWLAMAEHTLGYYARRLEGGPAAMPQMLVAMDAARATARHVVIAGEAGAKDTRALAAEFDRRFLPGDLLLVADARTRPGLAALAPFAAGLAPKGGHATAYVCVNHACRLPTTDPKAFAAQLDEPPTRTRSHR
jgi:hypothetical protein